MPPDWSKLAAEFKGFIREVDSGAAHNEPTPNLKIDRELIAAEYWIFQRGWINLRWWWEELKSPATTRDGSVAVVQDVKIEHLSEPETTFNFAVERDHTYFVRNSGILVHNQTSTTPTFIVDPSGQVFPVPPGSTGPTPSFN